MSEEKEIYINAYTESNSVVFEISNTYVNEIDIVKIHQAGTTTKGKGRGYGLALVETILNENKIFENEIKKENKYFVQILKIKI